VLVVTLVVCVVLIDAVAYFALGVRGSRHGSEDFVQFSPLLGHFHRPLTQGKYYRQRGRDGQDVQINSRGFCDEERDIEKTRPRIVLIGDSTTEAWEVDPHERPHVVLEEALEGRFEVLNLGVRAYGTDQSLILLEHLGMAFRPDVVVYTFCINDIRDNAKRTGKPYFEVDEADTGRLVTLGYPVSYGGTEGKRAADPVWKYSLVYRTVGLASSKFGRLTSDAGTGLPLEEHFELTPYKAVYGERETARWRVTRRLVREMRAVAASGGAEFLVVENLHKPEIDADYAGRLTAPYGGEATFDFDKVTRLFEGFADDTGVAFVSLAREARRDERTASDLMPPGDATHLSAEGIRLWARAVAGELESRGWLGM
jgi:lysophospholipase L1-like esterase